jgi:plasmid stabilization system protein ParE
MRVRYTPRAHADLAAIFDYLDARSPAAAQSVKTTIERRIALLTDFSNIAPETELRRADNRPLSVQGLL